MPLNISFKLGFLLQNNVMGSTFSPETAPSGQFNSHYINVSVYPRWYSQISVEWNVPADWGNCLFNVYFGQTNNGPWELINPSPVGGTFLTESSSKMYSKTTSGYYIVEVILLDKGSTRIQSIPATWNVKDSTWVSLRSTEIQRREHILLSKFVGVKSYLFRKKSYGKRCPTCWSVPLEKVVKDRCTTCMGTSFEGGYFEGAPLYLQYDPTPHNRDRTYFGHMESNQLSAWTISLPEIRNHDIILRTGDWNAYIVDRMANTELMANPVKQYMVLTQLSKNDVEYELVTRGLPEFPQKYL